ncbi:MAG: hypothetical protein WCG80_01660 [Spirochaetales bacterium]
MFDELLSKLHPFSEVFVQHGRSVYLVGGAVRNLLMGLGASDLDFATDATPGEVMSYFPRVIPTGIRHGTVTVLYRKQAFEVTTFRIDGTYSDARRPDSVTYTSNLEEDLSRRDFTINAMAVDLSNGELLDIHGGQSDLSERILRAIGNPVHRFTEDALRILRFFRFAAQFDFGWDPRTFDAAVELSPNLSSVSRERIRDELLKILGSTAVSRIWPTLEQQGVLRLLFPGLACIPLATEVYECWALLDPLQRLSVWLAAGSAMERSSWEPTLRNLKLSSLEVTSVMAPLLAIRILESRSTLLERSRTILSHWNSREVIEHHAAVLECLSRSGAILPSQDTVEELRALKRPGTPVFLAELAVNGNDLIQAGLNPGPEVGTTLQRLLKLVWERPELNERLALLSFLKSQ